MSVVAGRATLKKKIHKSQQLMLKSPYPLYTHQVFYSEFVLMRSSGQIAHYYGQIAHY